MAAHRLSEASKFPFNKREKKKGMSPLCEWGKSEGTVLEDQIRGNFL